MGVRTLSGTAQYHGFFRVVLALPCHESCINIFLRVKSTDVAILLNLLSEALSVASTYIGHESIKDWLCVYPK